MGGVTGSVMHNATSIEKNLIFQGGGGSQSCLFLSYVIFEWLSNENGIDLSIGISSLLE